MPSAALRAVCASIPTPDTSHPSGPLKPITAFFDDLRTTFTKAHSQLKYSTAARLFAIALLHPLDAAKTRLQVSNATSPAAVATARRGPFFAGLTPALIGHLPHGALAFTLYSVLMNRLAEHVPRVDARVRTVAAACASDALAALWLAPIELVKVRVQAGVASNSLVSARAGGLFVGTPAQILRDAPFRALYIVAFEALRSRYERRKGRELVTSETTVIGAAVGASVAAVTSPLDVVRTRIMAQRAGAGRAYSNYVDCFQHIIRRDGLRGVYRGLMPRAVYMGASVALFSIGYEAVRKAVDEKWIKMARSSRGE